jgi:hypothetical protein
MGVGSIEVTVGARTAEREYVVEIVVLTIVAVIVWGPGASPNRPVVAAIPWAFAVVGVESSAAPDPEDEVICH